MIGRKTGNGFWCGTELLWPLSISWDELLLPSATVCASLPQSPSRNGKSEGKKPETNFPSVQLLTAPGISKGELSQFFSNNWYIFQLTFRKAGVAQKSGVNKQWLNPLHGLGFECPARKNRWILVYLGSLRSRMFHQWAVKVSVFSFKTAQAFWNFKLFTRIMPEVQLLPLSHFHSSKFVFPLFIFRERTCSFKYFKSCLGLSAPLLLWGFLYL